MDVENEIICKCDNCNVVHKIILDLKTKRGAKVKITAFMDIEFEVDCECGHEFIVEF